MQKTFTWTAEAGSHAFKAVADSNEMVAENDETNNLKVLNLPLSDLIVENITWSPENPLIGDKVTFTTTIKNQGSGRSDYSNITYFIDSSSIGTQDVPEIDAGATAQKTSSWFKHVPPRRPPCSRTHVSFLSCGSG